MRRHKEAWKGFVAGAAGGLAATLVMTEFQNAWGKAAEIVQNGRRKQQLEQEQSQQNRQQEPDATMRAAEKISKRLLKHPLNMEQQKKLGPVVHYAFGTLMGGFYGLATEYLPAARRGVGLPFGAALFVGADEIAVPALGLSKPARSAPLSSHIYAFASHLVYGATAELVRSGVRRALD